MGGMRFLSRSFIREVCAHREHGTSICEIAEMYGCDRETIERALCSNRRKQRRIKKLTENATALTDERKEEINRWLELDCTLSLEKIVQRIKFVFGLTVNRVIVADILKELFYTIKRKSPVFEIVNDEKTILLRFDYALQMLVLDCFRDKNFFIFDADYRIQSRSIAPSKPVNIQEKRYLSRNVSIRLTLNYNYLLNFTVLKQRCFMEDVRDYLNELFSVLDMKNITGANIFIPHMDSDMVQKLELLTSDRGHFLILIPPYSYPLNPAETFSLKLKTYLERLGPCNREQVFEMLEKIPDVITPSDCTVCYDLMTEYNEIALRKETFGQLPYNS